MIEFGGLGLLSLSKSKIQIPEESDLWYWYNNGFSTLQIRTKDYEKPDYIHPYKAGNEYHIVMYKQLYPCDKPNKLENFTCVLVHPPTFIKALISNKYFGIIGRCLTDSSEYYNIIFEKIQSAKISTSFFDLSKVIA